MAWICPVQNSVALSFVEHSTTQAGPYTRIPDVTAWERTPTVNRPTKRATSDTGGLKVAGCGGTIESVFNIEVILNDDATFLPNNIGENEAGFFRFHFPPYDGTSYWEVEGNTGAFGMRFDIDNNDAVESTLEVDVTSETRVVLA